MYFCDLESLLKCFSLSFFSMKGMYKTGDAKFSSAVMSNIQN